MTAAAPRARAARTKDTTTARRYGRRNPSSREKSFNPQPTLLSEVRRSGSVDCEHRLAARLRDVESDVEPGVAEHPLDVARAADDSEAATAQVRLTPRGDEYANGRRVHIGDLA